MTASPGGPPAEGPWNPQLRVLCGVLGGLLLGAASYSFGGVIWRCAVVALTGGLATWVVTGSLISAAQTWPMRINQEGQRRAEDLWRVPALGLTMAEPTQFESRLRPRLQRLAEESLAARQIKFDSAQGRTHLGERNHDILKGAGNPPTRAELQALIRKVTSLNEHSGSGGADAIDDALATVYRRRSLSQVLRR